MQTPGPTRWFHTQIWLYGHWLPGDAKGFRNKKHRIHSSGDYKSPPPPDEHAGLQTHARRLLKQPPITLTPQQRKLLGELLLRWCRLKHIPVAAVSVGGAHAHLLAKLPIADTDATIGKAKRYASCESRKQDPSLPSKLFAGKGEPKPVESWGHLVASQDYAW